MSRHIQGTEEVLNFIIYFMLTNFKSAIPAYMRLLVHPFNKLDTTLPKRILLHRLCHLSLVFRRKILP